MVINRQPNKIVKHSNNSSAVMDELIERVWPFLRLALKKNFNV